MYIYHATGDKCDILYALHNNLFIVIKSDTVDNKNIIEALAFIRNNDFNTFVTNNIKLEKFNN